MLVSFYALCMLHSERVRIERETAWFIAGLIALSGAVLLMTAAYETGTFGSYGCTRSDRAYGHTLASDPAVARLLARYEHHEAPATGCDDDDITISADVEWRATLPRREALADAERVLQTSGWHRSRVHGRCYNKVVAGRPAMAMLTYNDEFRANPDSNVSLELVNHRCR